ncbi:MAG TPA: UDP-N-acetylmuramoyl-L-alanine--D-glutamate ligase [Balneolaceae bacterium]|nr:UDP-N-acetylmuramoyl-L-alanine--D-glutamate ligase [Balneolaceae bacterium]
MKDIENKYIVVAGAARSGVAAACLLKNNGSEVFVTDSSPIAEYVKERLIKAGIDYEENGHTLKSGKGDFLVTSPGVPDSSSIIQKYLNDGKEVYSEIEAASWFNSSPIVGVTGSNGKTTVTNWLAHIWKTSGRSFVLAGNIGTAFADRVDETSPGKTAILEVSSFQLDHIEHFHPSISVILNITPDHLDRYDQDFEKYSRSKLRITENQNSNNYFIYNFEDPVLRNHAESLKKSSDSPRLLAFSDKRELENGAFIREKNIILKIDNTEETLMPFADIQLPGQHNLNNGLATALAARASEIEKDWIREALSTFEGVEHRLEPVRTLKGIQYVNDSKATNINAVWYALDSFNVPIVLILGGRDKGNDYLQLKKQLVKKVHTVIAIGEAREAIKNQLQDVVPYVLEANSLKEAVKLSREKAKRGEIVLLSPACSSFDMFENYEDRGRQFKQAVLEL